MAFNCCFRGPPSSGVLKFGGVFMIYFVIWLVVLKLPRSSFCSLLVEWLLLKEPQLDLCPPSGSGADFGGFSDPKQEVQTGSA